MMLNVKSLRVRAVEVPLNKPVEAHIGKFTKWPFICIDIHTNQSIVGRSYIAPYLSEYVSSIISSINALFQKFIDREINPYQFFKEGMQSISLLGYKGIALYALAALDIAFWDAKAKSAGIPLANYLGGSLKPIKAYNSRGLWLIPLKDIAKEAEQLIKEGDFKAIKLRIGRESFQEDIEALNSIKKNLGDSISIMSDFNQCYNLSDAIKRCSHLDEMNFYWFEEPIRFDDYDGCSKLSKMFKTPFIIGENFHGPVDAKTALVSNASSMIMPDLMRIGGVSGWLKTAAIAETFNIPVSTHLFPEVSAHLMSVTPTADWLEWVDWSNPLLKSEYRVKNGNIIIPDVPGVGIEWNEENLEKYSLQID